MHWHSAALTKQTNIIQMDKTLKYDSADSKRKFDNQNLKIKCLDGSFFMDSHLKWANDDSK